MSFDQLRCVITIFAAILAATIQSGYVDLYRDADFKHKLARVNDVVLDACYSFTCKNLDNVITSAKWHDLPETGSFFEGGDAVIFFYTGENCDGKEKWWYINTQSRKDRLDGMNDDISSFMVLNRGGNAGAMYICSLSESDKITNTTDNEIGANDTINYLLG
ncbi:Hypothetical protein PHPALM_5103 [Phytophthora palmivora]|uniref:Uncharacterized protein n=1 Tax=Phytophthora palmivora TaxID=4796 RepID=A0A2P4YI70_9STRA|nr:Hypothetical protein PHPALM_5103 [Phytophthora palmivora]